MIAARIVLALAILTLACADNETVSTTSGPLTPSTPPPLDGLATDVLLVQPSDASPPLCKCFFNEKRQLTELVCSANDDLEPEDDIGLGAILSYNCTFALVEVSNHNLEVISADTFAAKPQLQYVHLYSDHIEHIDREAFKVLRALVEVDLSDNSLLSVDSRLFVDNSLLTSVSLADNPLIDLKSNAPILESDSITSLDLSMCKLTSLSVESFSKLPNLRRLDLSSNNIQQLPVTALQSLPQLNALNLANNRWRCDCAFKEVIDFAKTMEETDGRVRCFTPDKMLVSWTNKTAEVYCPVQEYDDDEYNYDDDYNQGDNYNHDDTMPVIEDADKEESDLLVISSNLQKDTDDLRLEMSDLLNADSEVTEVAETTDVDDTADEIIIVFRGDDSEASVSIFPVAMLVFALTALIVFGVGVTVVVCKAVIRGYHQTEVRREGWNKLNEEGGEAVYVKVPLK